MMLVAHGNHRKLVKASVTETRPIAQLPKAVFDPKRLDEVRAAGFKSPSVDFQHAMPQNRSRSSGSLVSAEKRTPITGNEQTPPILN